MSLLEELLATVEKLKTHEREFRKAHDELMFRYGFIHNPLDGTFTCSSHSPFAKEIVAMFTPNTEDGVNKGETK